MAYQGPGQMGGFDDSRSRLGPGANVRYLIALIYQRASQLTYDPSNIFHHAMEKGPTTRLKDLCCKKNQKAHLLAHLMILTPEESHLLSDLDHIIA